MRRILMLGLTIVVFSGCTAQVGGFAFEVASPFGVSDEELNKVVDERVAQLVNPPLQQLHRKHDELAAKVKNEEPPKPSFSK